MEVSNSGERPPRQGGRYYSVHRQNGRQPDVLEMPEPYLPDGDTSGDYAGDVVDQSVEIPAGGGTPRPASWRIRVKPSAECSAA